MDPSTLSTEDKVSVLRKYREEQYEHLLDAVYLRRGWTKDGIPKLSTLKRLGIDLPGVVEVVKGAGVTE